MTLNLGFNIEKLKGYLDPVVLTERLRAPRSRRLRSDEAWLQTRFPAKVFVRRSNRRHKRRSSKDIVP